MDSTSFWMIGFSTVLAYEVVLSSALRAPTSYVLALVPPALLGAAADIAAFDSLTLFQTSCCCLSAITLFRTLGWAITDACVSNLLELSIQRPCSTQNTERSTGSLSAGTILSLPTTRSCFPPVTTSPASRISGRLELLTSTNRFTSALFGCWYIGRGWRRIIPAIFPTSVTTISPERMPSSSVINPLVSWTFSATTGKIVRSPWVMGARILYSLTGAELPTGADGLAAASTSMVARVMNAPQTIRFFMCNSFLIYSPGCTYGT